MSDDESFTDATKKLLEALSKKRLSQQILLEDGEESIGLWSSKSGAIYLVAQDKYGYFSLEIDHEKWEEIKAKIDRRFQERE